ncbi:MAG TPA: LON peptidase substrate-binding domain-containing protein [Candidatus Nanopelagicales bacterium]|nr:LON peptidase substrate-binding domain-containing protein [Candidatus Nanopelagicales bacterium]
MSDRDRSPGTREVIALFPLGTVLVPGLVLPLRIFEPRYVALLHDLAALEPPDRFFGVVAIREGHEVGETGVRALHEVGTTAVLQEVRWDGEDAAEVVTAGEERFRLRGLVAGAPYPQAEVEWLGESDGDEAAVLAPAVAEALISYRRAAGQPSIAGEQLAAEDPRLLSYLVAVAMILDVVDRQRLLDQPDTSSRLRTALALLRRETALLVQLPSLPAVDLRNTDTTLN